MMYMILVLAGRRHVCETISVRATGIMVVRPGYICIWVTKSQALPLDRHAGTVPNNQMVCLGDTLRAGNGGIFLVYSR